MKTGRNNSARRLAEFYDPPLDQDDTHAEVLESKKEPSNEAALERHYSVNEIASIWQLDPKMIRRIFGNEPGVVTIGSDESRYRRAYRTLRIPESVLVRVHRRIRKAS